MSKREVSRVCAARDTEVAAFRARPLAETAYPYLWLDATYPRGREAGHVVSMAAPGRGRGLRIRGAPGPRARPRHEQRRRRRLARLHPRRRRPRGPLASVHEELLGSSGQRCLVHLTRDAHRPVPRSTRTIVASAICVVFGRPDDSATRRRLDVVIDMIAPRFPRVAVLLTKAEPDPRTHLAFSDPHRRQIRSPNRTTSGRTAGVATSPGRWRLSTPRP